MEREPQGGSDYGTDHRRELGDEPAPAIRDAPPDILGPIDASAPVSGHVPAPESSSSIADTPEHDWSAASKIIFPALRPVGTQGLAVSEIDPETLSTEATRGHSQPLVDEGPCGIPVVYALDVGAFDVIVNGDHLLTWGVGATEIQDAALRNLAAWSATAAWTDEVSGERRLLSSDTGDGWDASRILLPDVLDRLTAELGATGRVLVGLPERHLLIAGTLRPGDDEFAGLFGDFIVEQSGGADEPIDRRVFELVGGRLVEFAGRPAS
jgi:uncharacterized protein DUF1444